MLYSKNQEWFPQKAEDIFSIKKYLFDIALQIQGVALPIAESMQILGVQNVRGLKS